MLNKCISVIVPIFNVENFIERCVRSLLEQTYQNIEFIFVDDCSPDNSVSILESIINEYPNRKNQIHFIKHDINKGSSTTRNTGLKLATGEYLYHCDSDDYIENNAIDEMYNAIIKNNADIVYCDLYIYKHNKDTIFKQNSIEPKNEYLIKGLMTEKLHGAVWNKMYKRTLFTENNINFPDNYNICEDLYVNIKIFHFAKKIEYLPKALYHYCYNENSISASDNIEKKTNEVINNVISIEKFFREKQINIYNEEINILKLVSKQCLLFTLEKEKFKKWREIFPEANKYIMKYTSLPLHLRLLGFAITKKLWILTDLWILLKKMKNYFK